MFCPQQNLEAFRMQYYNVQRRLQSEIGSDRIEACEAILDSEDEESNFGCQVSRTGFMYMLYVRNMELFRGVADVGMINIVGFAFDRWFSARWAVNVKLKDGGQSHTQELVSVSTRH